MKGFITLLIGIGLFITPLARAKTKVLRKVQEVNFSEASLKGTVRNPDGIYLVQKRGMKFMPLYDLQKSLDSKIRESVMYVQ